MADPPDFERMPFTDLLGVEITVVGDGYAEGELPLEERHSSLPEKLVAHGGVTSTLADTVGGAAAVSVNGVVTPTIDMRVDYLAPATSDLHAEAEVLRNGNSVCVVDVSVFDADEVRVADARGVYKTSGADPGDETAWTTGGRSGGSP